MKSYTITLLFACFILIMNTVHLLFKLNDVKDNLNTVTTNHEIIIHEYEAELAFEKQRIEYFKALHDVAVAEKQKVEFELKYCLQNK